MNFSNLPVRLVIATGNAGKVRDFRTVFEGFEHPIPVTSISEFGGMPEVEETEPDFAGNARLKVQAACSVISDRTGIWTLADDSGLSVDALGGEPGVHSARFAGADATDADNRNKLLRLLDGVPIDGRMAHFTCHLCLISPEGVIFDFVGICEGTVALEAAGTHGFGYDPLFIPEGGDATWGEMEDGDKNADSHRFKAIQEMLNWFRNRDS